MVGTDLHALLVCCWCRNEAIKGGSGSVRVYCGSDSIDQHTMLMVLAEMGGGGTRCSFPHCICLSLWVKSYNFHLLSDINGINGLTSIRHLDMNITTFQIRIYGQTNSGQLTQALHTCWQMVPIADCRSSLGSCPR